MLTKFAITCCVATFLACVTASQGTSIAESPSGERRYLRKLQKCVKDGGQYMNVGSNELPTGSHCCSGYCSTLVQRPSDTMKWCKCGSTGGSNNGTKSGNQGITSGIKAGNLPIGTCIANGDNYTLFISANAGNKCCSGICENQVELVSDILSNSTSSATCTCVGSISLISGANFTNATSSIKAGNQSVSASVAPVSGGKCKNSWAGVGYKDSTPNDIICQTCANSQTSTVDMLQTQGCTTFKTSAKGCLAVMMDGHGGYGLGSGTSRAAAIAQAMTKCKAAAKVPSKCGTYYSACANA